MKAILKTTKKAPFKQKVFIRMIFVVGIIAFVFSIKFSGNGKNNFPDLRSSEKIRMPECSSPGGFYEESFFVKLDLSDSNGHIFYTTDGSEPSLASSEYIQPFIIEDRTEIRNNLSLIPTSPRWKPPIGNVFKGTILRAIAVNEKNEKSKELIQAFFVKGSSSKKYTLPLISIVVNPKDLFGYNRGIYVLGKNYLDKDNYIRKGIPLDLPWWEYPSNYLMRGSDAERDAFIQFFEPNGKLGFESDVGIRIHGNATRGFAQKSIRVCFREKYGKPQLYYDLFDHNSKGVYNSFILRNSGNDWNKTMFRDAFMQSLMQNSQIDIQDYRPSVVFINGEYWGIHNIRERFDEHYLSNKYNLNVDSISILELGGELVQGTKEDEEEFKELIDFVKENDLSDDSNYDYIQSKIDINSFTDFIIANVYFCNSDWPNNNVKFWKYASLSDSIYAKDGRWRWMLYDTDWGFGYNSMSSPQSNLLLKATSVGSVGLLFGKLIKNKQFADMFLARFQLHLNTTFNSSVVVKKIDDIQKLLQPEIEEHIDRWRAIESYSEWLENVDVLRKFARERPALQADQLNVFFNLKDSRQITLKKLPQKVF